MREPRVTRLELLKAVQYALNTVRRTNLRGCPGGFRDTYEVAAEVDAHVQHAQENKEDTDA